MLPKKITTLNPLITAATPIITLMLQIKHARAINNVTHFRNLIISEMRQFEKMLSKEGCQQRTIFAAQYCLCTAFDEAVLSSAWGVKSIWSEQSLLSLFHQETWGGERFYIILETILKESRKNIALIEFLYLLLSLGFEGKFFSKGIIIREEIRSRVFQLIRDAHGKMERNLSPLSETNHLIEKHPIKNSSLKRCLAFSLILMGFLFGGFNISSYRKASPLLQNLEKMGHESPITAYSQLISRPIIPESYQ